MTDLQLRELAAYAERAVPLPELAVLEARGRALRERRRGVGIGLALVLALVGTWALQHATRVTVEPVRPPELPLRGEPYPGNHMQDLPAGTYQVFPSSVRGEPSARMTVPAGWNTWEGPNRFDGHAPGRSNTQALAHSTWYVGALVVKLVAVSARLCATAFASGDFIGTHDETVAALRHLPGYRTTRRPESVEAFGYPATHLSFVATDALRDCGTDTTIYATSRNGTFGGVERTEAWVVDVQGVPLTVFASSSGDVPIAVQDELDAVIDSIEFVTSDD